MIGRTLKLALATGITAAVTATAAHAAGMDIRPDSAPPAYLNKPYSETFYGANATFPAAVQPFSIEWTSGSLPEGLTYSIAPDGAHLTVSGTPTRIESTQFTLSAHDSTDKSGTRGYTLEVKPIEAPALPPQVAAVKSTVESIVAYYTWVVTDRLSKEPRCIEYRIMGLLHGSPPPPGC